jgi:hypothetical protein
MWFFKLNEIEYDRAQKFESKHQDHAQNFSYIFTVRKGSNDFVCRIKCNGCAKSESISDFGDVK